MNNFTLEGITIKNKDKDPIPNLNIDPPTLIKLDLNDDIDTNSSQPLLQPLIKTSLSASKANDKSKTIEDSLVIKSLAEKRNPSLHQKHSKQSKFTPVKVNMRELLTTSKSKKYLDQKNIYFTNGLLNNNSRPASAPASKVPIPKLDANENDLSSLISHPDNFMNLVNKNIPPDIDYDQKYQNAMLDLNYDEKKVQPTVTFQEIPVSEPVSILGDNNSHTSMENSMTDTEPNKIRHETLSSLSARDYSALKIGRLILSSVLNKPEISTADSISRFFLDLWLSQCGSNVIEADAVNIEIMCNFERAIRDFENNLKMEPDCHVSNQRVVCAFACEALDRLINEYGAKLPILREIKAAITPCIFMKLDELPEANYSLETNSADYDFYATIPSATRRNSIEGFVENMEIFPSLSKSDIRTKSKSIDGAGYLKLALWSEDSSEITQKLQQSELKCRELEYRYAQLEIAFKKAEEMKDIINQLNAEIEEDKKVISTFKSTLQHQRLVTKDLKKKLADETAALATTRNSYLKELRAKAKFQEELSEAKDREASQDRIIQELRKDVVSLRQKILDQPALTGDSSQDFKAAIVRASDLRSQIKVSREENEALKHRMDDLQANMRLINSRCEEYQKTEIYGKNQARDIVIQLGSSGLGLSPAIENENDFGGGIGYIVALAACHAAAVGEINKLRELNSKSESTIASLTQMLHDRINEAEETVKKVENSHTLRLNEINSLHRMRLETARSETVYLRKQYEELVDLKESLQQTIKINNEKEKIMVTSFTLREEKFKEQIKNLKEVIARLDNSLLMAEQDLALQVKYQSLHSQLEDMEVRWVKADATIGSCLYEIGKLQAIISEQEKQLAAPATISRRLSAHYTTAPPTEGNSATSTAATAAAAATGNTAHKTLKLVRHNTSEIEVVEVSQEITRLRSKIDANILNHDRVCMSYEHDRSILIRDLLRMHRPVRRDYSKNRKTFTNKSNFATKRKGSNSSQASLTPSTLMLSRACSSLEEQTPDVDRNPRITSLLNSASNDSSSESDSDMIKADRAHADELKRLHDEISKKFLELSKAKEEILDWIEHAENLENTVLRCEDYAGRLHASLAKTQRELEIATGECANYSQLAELLEEQLRDKESTLQELKGPDHEIEVDFMMSSSTVLSQDAPIISRRTSIKSRLIGNNSPTISKSKKNLLREEDAPISNTNSIDISEKGPPLTFKKKATAILSKLSSAAKNNRQRRGSIVDAAAAAAAASMNSTTATPAIKKKISSGNVSTPSTLRKSSNEEISSKPNPSPAAATNEPKEVYVDIIFQDNTDSEAKAAAAVAALSVEGTPKSHANKLKQQVEEARAETTAAAPSSSPTHTTRKSFDATIAKESVEPKRGSSAAAVTPSRPPTPSCSSKGQKQPAVTKACSVVQAELVAGPQDASDPSATPPRHVRLSLLQPDSDQVQLCTEVEESRFLNLLEDASYNRKTNLVEVLFPSVAVEDPNVTISPADNSTQIDANRVREALENGLDTVPVQGPASAQASSGYVKTTLWKAGTKTGGAAAGGGGGAQPKESKRRPIHFTDIALRNEKKLAKQVAILKLQLREAQSAMEKVTSRLSGTVFTGLDGAAEHQKIEKIIADVDSKKSWIFNSRMFQKVLSNSSGGGHINPVEVTASLNIWRGYDTEDDELRVGLQEDSLDSSLDLSIQINEQSEKLQNEIRKVKAKVYKDAKSFGGWKSLVYRKDGTVDLGMSLSGWSDPEKVSILKEMIFGLQREEEERRQQEKQEISRVVAILNDLKKQIVAKDATIFDLRQMCADQNISPTSSGEKLLLAGKEEGGVSPEEFDTLQGTLLDLADFMSTLCRPVTGPSRPQSPRQNYDLSLSLAQKGDASPLRPPPGCIQTSGQRTESYQGPIKRVRMKSPSANTLTGGGGDHGSRRGVGGNTPPPPNEYFGNPGVLWRKMETQARRRRALDLLHRRPLAEGREEGMGAIPPIVGDNCVIADHTNTYTHKTMSNRFPEQQQQYTLPGSNNVQSEPINDDSTVLEDKDTHQSLTTKTDTFIKNLATLCNDLKSRVLFGQTAFQEPTNDDAAWNPSSQSLLKQHSEGLQKTLPAEVRIRAECLNDQVNRHLAEARRIQREMYGLVEMDEAGMKIAAEKYYANLITLSTAPQNIVEIANRFSQGSGSSIALKFCKSSSLPSFRPLAHPASFEHELEDHDRQRFLAKSTSKTTLIPNGDNRLPDIPTVPFLKLPEYRPKSSPLVRTVPTVIPR